MKNNTITIVFSVNNYYVPYLSVVLHSIKQYASAEYFYEIIILNRDITEENKKNIKNEFIKNVDWNIVFIDMSSWIKGVDFYVGNRLTIETYFRLFLPWILECNDKIIYLDCDVIVKHDISELWSYDIDDFLLGATRDCGIIGYCYNSNFDRKEYTQEVLKLKRLDTYIQAGVLLINLKRFREKYTMQKIINIVNNNKFRHHDQDILNILCENDIYYVNQSWNYIIDNKKLKMYDSILMAPQEVITAYEMARENPYIVHYASEQKPWICFNCEYGNLFRKAMEYSCYKNTIILRKKMEDEKRYNFLYIGKKMIDVILNQFILPIGSKRRKILKKLLKRSIYYK